jgi:capsular polysaccharide biosynthesis protein
MTVRLDGEDIQIAGEGANPAPAPQDLKSLIDIAQSFERANNWDEAERSWRLILLLNENFWLPHVALAQIYGRLGRRDDLKKALEAAEKVIPDDQHVAKARIAELAENWAAAPDRWRSVVEAFPDVWQHYVSLSRAFEKLGKISECIEVLWRAELRFYDQIHIVSELAQATQRHGLWAESERCWRKYLAAVPSDVYSVRHLALVTRKNRLSTAPDLLESSLFKYRTFNDAVKMMPEVVNYHELHPAVVRSLPPPSFCYGVSEEFIENTINHLKFYFSTGAFELSGAQVFRERLARCGDFILYGHQVETHEQAIRNKLDEEFLLPVRELKLRRSERPLVSLQIGAYPVYGHWLVDVMPQIFALRELGISLDDVDFVLPDLLPNYYLEFLSYCDIKEHQILLHKHNVEMIDCPMLLIPTHMNNTRTFVPSFPGAVQWFRNNVERQHGSLRDESKPKRLFVPRRDTTSGRPLLNRAEIINIAQSYGFHVMLPETLPLIEQWRYFASADLIVGEYGSALHATLVSEPGTVVCCLRAPTNDPGYLQSGVGEALSQPTGYIFGVIDETGNRRSYTIDPEIFTECLNLLTQTKK